VISIASPIIESEEIEAVNQVLQSGVLAQGPKVSELETAFAAYCGTKYAAAVNSGTAAIHAALYAAGVRGGDEVITVPFSFIATINPILMLNARPVLVDIDPQTFNLDVTKLEQAITSKTKAILPVHLYGQPADMDEIQAIAAKHGLKVIEDACQAVGAEYKGKCTGGLGNAGCFSLYATKNIMCGEGGIVTTDDESYITAIKQFRQHGMSVQYEYIDLGYNYRMSDLHAAIAVEQLKKANDFTALRRRNATLLDEGLTGITGLIRPEIADDRTHVYHQYTVRITDDFPVKRHDLVVALKEKGIIAGVYYPKCLHTFPHVAKFGYSVGDFPVAEQAAAEVLSLPVHPRVSEADVQTVIDAIKDICHAN
jgi:perosamine synthetase